jgi:hypothetical protein
MTIECQGIPVVGQATETVAGVITSGDGTFTATLTALTSGTIALSPNADTLTYVKMGRIVSIHGYISVASSNGVGALRLGGLPYPAADQPEYGGASVFSLNLINLAIIPSGVVAAVIDEGESVIKIKDDFCGTGNVSDDFANHLKTATEIYIFGSYLAAS